MLKITQTILVMASAAMAFAGLASAQATCALDTPTVKIIRAEGTSELLAPLVITCTPVNNGALATTASVNVSLPGATITSKVLDASAGKTEVVAVVSTTPGTQVFGTVTADNINFNGLAIPAISSTTAYTITISNIRVNGGLVAAAGSIPVIDVSGYIVSANAANVPLTLFDGGQYAYILNGLAAPAFYKAYTTGAVGGAFTAFSKGVATVESTNSKNSFTTCVTASPASETVNLDAAATAAGSSLAFVVRVGSNFTGAFRRAAHEASSLAVTSGLNTNTVRNGTRLQISFPTLPAGVSIYVPTTEILSTATFTSSIQLSTTAAGTAHAAATPSADSNVWNGATKGSSALALVSGTAVFEVLTDVDGNPTFDIPVFVVAKANTVAPGSTLSATVGFSPNGSTAIPNFTAGRATVGGSTFSACSTSLLFPFVTNLPGFDVGIVIANTSSDPTNLLKLNQTGTCSLNFYGAGAPATAASTGAVAAGQIYAGLLSEVAPGFRGYMVAKCDFQYAHGYAYLSYGLGTSAAMASGYLANVIGTGTRTFTNGNETLGN